MGKNRSESLSDLFDTFVSVLKGKLGSDGCDAQTLKVIRDFLNDNKIGVDPGSKAAAPLRSLADRVPPTFGADEDEEAA